MGAHAAHLDSIFQAVSKLLEDTQNSHLQQRHDPGRLLTVTPALSGDRMSGVAESGAAHAGGGARQP